MESGAGLHFARPSRRRERSSGKGHGAGLQQEYGSPRCRFALARAGFLVHAYQAIR